MIDGDRIATGLRVWGKGTYETEAAAELLIRACGSRFASPIYPWVQESAASLVWLDAEKMSGHTAHLSGGEQRLLAVVQALATAGPLWNLGGVLAGVDRDQLLLILAALAHADGSHEQVDVTRTDEGLVFMQLAPIVAWPEPAAPEGWAV